MTTKKATTKATTNTSTKRKVVTQPATAAGAGVTLTSVVPFLPATWQPYGYGIAALLGVVAPLLAAHQGQQRASD